MTRLFDPAADVTDDAILNGRLRLLQPRRGHRFGHDAILLAAAVPAKRGQRVAEFGAGVGAASLALLSRVPDTDATLFEIDETLCALAKDNIARNRFADRARVVVQDVGALLAAGAFDHIFMNPPFNDAIHQSSPDAGRRAAHAGDADLLPRWIDAAAGGLREGGTVTVIWRAEDLDDVLRALAAGFGAVSVTPIHPAPDSRAIRIIAGAVRGSRMAMRILPVLMLNDAEKRPTAEAEAILRGGAALRSAGT